MFILLRERFFVFEFDPYVKWDGSDCNLNMLIVALFEENIDWCLAENQIRANAVRGLYYMPFFSDRPGNAACSVFFDEIMKKRSNVFFDEFLKKKSGNRISYGIINVDAVRHSAG